MNKFYPPKPKINAFNDLFQCYLCQGYLINPTTIDACLHTYCRSCIVRHLAEDYYCPRCKGNGGKTVTHSNLKSDNVLRSIIYKLVPGLYQKERERVVQFVNNAKNEGSTSADTLNALLESDDDFYTARDSISLSLEFHPHLAEQCDVADVPPVRYLKCLASLKIHHLKRFLCSKFDIDPSNRKVDIEIIYEDEVLPSDFTLMDVAYCYQYKGQAPLKLYYRILIYPEEHFKTPEIDNQSGIKTNELSTNHTSSESKKSTKDETAFLTPSPVTTKLKTSKTPASKHQSTDQSVKMTISSKPTESAKKSVSKRSSLVEDFTIPTTTTNDFKSLRSNDIRYSQFGVPPTPPTTPTTLVGNNSTSSKTKVKSTASVVIKEEKPPKCDIVVSIPHNQMQDEWDTKPLSQLKTACKKSPPTSNASDDTTTPSSASSKKVRNVPKLKIELNSLKTKLIEKPKSADIRLDTLMLKQHKPRKFSLDEPQLSNDKVDLETYVKNIGLKPIEVQTSIHTAPAEMETAGKFTPNASPRSSCSSSTTSSSNGYLHVSGTEHSKSSHKKRKKKHSKESKDSKRSKKMHAEISSQMADESLKMKVKLTTPLSIKPSKLESKKSPHNDKISTDHFSFDKPHKSAENKTKLVYDNSKVVDVEKSYSVKDKFQFPSEKKSAVDSSSSSAQKLKPLAIKTTAKDFEDDDDISMPDIATALSLSKPLANIKDSKLPHSPPLPPSLFKTTPLTFSTFTPNVSTVANKTKPVVTAAKQIKDKPVVQPIKMKPLAPKPMPPTTKPPNSTPIKPPQFAVPNLPRLMASNSSKFLTSTPSSIASSANKHMGNLLKRSASMDEGKSAKQSKLDKPHQITVSAYGSNLQVTKVEVPATPTSSTAKATYEIPLYSPLSASYNPKCSFTVGSTTSGNRTNLPSSPSGSMAPNCKSPIFTTNTTSLKKSEKEVAKVTTATATTTTSSSSLTTNTSLMSFSLNKTPTLMGPPTNLPKLNTVVPTSVKSPPLGSLVHKPLSGTSSLGLINARSNLSNSSALQSCPKAESITSPSTSTIKNANSGPMEKPTSSLRQFRLPSRESGQDILDLSATPKTPNGIQSVEKKSISKPTTPTVSIPGSPTMVSTGSPLEMALSKIKQNITNNISQESKSNTTTIDLKPNSEDLQNLHLLSESATAREKIAITSPGSSATTSTTSVYEKPKINTNSLVRQQNASVRSIPNPSALAFRNHQPAANNIPMVTIAAPLISSLSNEVDKTFLSKQPTSPHSPLSSLPLGSNVTTSSITPLRNTITATSLSSKRHPSIDQVAASLNIRATAAAAEASAKSNLKQLDDITSKSTLAEMNGGSKLKQQIKQEAVEQPTTTTTAAGPVILASPKISQTSSAMHLSEVSSTEIVEIKKEPEERCSEASSSLAGGGDEQREVKAIFTVSSNNNNNNNNSISSNNTHQSSTPTPASSSLVSKVENLVTSVINVSTPTSSLLTTSSAGY
ncbi:protein suppressor 2 of zeste [Musca vetustissima]|uniref:protein suppressor 2 of zeste n=1 Tax=Musca vetustissima TaxID=27455 RepID=UPI002AB65310|nr:protein suppressor 2 of zeste [Musca vetustissima]